GVSRDMFRHIGALSMSFFDQNETGRVMARMQNDVTVLQATLSSGFISILGIVLSLGGIFVTLLLLNLQLALMVFVTVPVLVGGFKALDGSLELGFLVSFVLYTNRFFDPIRDATQQYINLQRATVAAERIFEILDTPQTVQEKPDAEVLQNVRGGIEFRDV